MGRNNRRLWEGKPCVLCGGKKAAETAEHAPPIVLFHDKLRPQGLEVPACKRCNNGNSDVDQLVAFLALSQAPDSVFGSRGLSPHEVSVIKGTANNSPKVYESARRVPVREHRGKRMTTAHEMELTAQTSRSVAQWAAKQALAIWYVRTGTIASHRSTIDIKLLPNAVRPDATLDELIRSMGVSQSLSTARNFTDDQFNYKFHLEDDMTIAVVFAQYHGGFAFVGVIKDRPTAKLSRMGLEFKFGTNAARGIHSLY